MKTSVVLVISVVHLLLAFSSSQVVVCDVNGEIVISETKYFIMPAIRGFGGGVTRGPIFNVANGLHDTNISCPFQVEQIPEEETKGMPVYFKPMGTDRVEIIESSYLNIDLYIHYYEICNNTVWKVEEGLKWGDPALLSTNGVIGDFAEVESWFQIRRYNDFSYKLVHCTYAGIICRDVGISYSNSERRLALNTDNTFQLVFIKDTQHGINSII